MDTPSRAAGTVTDPVLAAGVLLWTGPATAPRFLLLQNARHRTWGFAKGHAEAGEDLHTTALREVQEETGYALTADELVPGFADTHAYQPTGKHWKRVIHFLAANPVDEASLAASAEHAQTTWATLEEALGLLQHPELERAVVRAAAVIARTP